MAGEPDNFGPLWSAAKLDRPRRRRELDDYVTRWLPELRTMPIGLVLDIGCGCGDFLDIVRSYGHGLLGIDAPDGSGGMGDGYLALSRVIRKELNVPVVECRLLDWIELPDDHLKGNVAVINCRGAIEMAFSDFMDGPSHDVDHRSDNKRWRETPETVAVLNRMMTAFCSLLRNGGILLISANGSANNGWYDRTIREAAEAAGLSPMSFSRSANLVFKWVKP